MNKPIDAPEPIACDIALREIPDSADVYGETEQYIVHYFGRECYQQWLALKQKKQQAA